MLRTIAPSRDSAAIRGRRSAARHVRGSGRGIVAWARLRRTSAASHSHTAFRTSMG
ncbi:hypothetical protein [Lentzea sp. HUAS12]|uniref:hypothetical protein n=1 Tax=Lentzea sp. HUAS12 TaxID=2951806 RepID=UPI0020A0B1BD|nr:hypothetical protein [Lentzea sp. HUAS12]USX55523.1 hypothetical protein ND450_15900 [Lentzea sp. HUAS12]